MAKTGKLPWRKALRAKMYDAARKEARSKTDSTNPPFHYRWEHVLAVVNNGIRLAALTGADAEIVEAAAWLHDIRKEQKNRHPEAGARYARQYLPRTDFPPKKIEPVAHVIAVHMGLWRDEPLGSLEAQVLWDADKLTKIGVLAGWHWVASDIAHNKAYSTEKIANRLSSAEWRARTVASMHTEPARRAAISRFEALNRMVYDLLTEWDGLDMA